MTTRPLRSRPATFVLLLVLLALPLAACAQGGGAGGSSESSDTDAASAPDAGGGAAAERSEQSRAALADGEPAESESGTSARTAPMERAVVSTGSVQLRSEDVGRARAEALRLVRGWGGLVADEESTADDGEPAYTSLTLRVPSGRFDTAMTELAGLGEVVDQSRTAEDVTTQVVDVGARLRAQERSVRRVEQLLAQAQDLGDVIAIESDLARRQADLDSLASQRAYLDDQTSLSTISLGIDRRTDDVPDDDAFGFLAGLDAGWSALVAATGAAATAVGALLPFAVVAVLLGVPVWSVVRRRRTHHEPPVAPVA